jgi:hypothetical protein
MRSFEVTLPIFLILWNNDVRFSRKAEHNQSGMLLHEILLTANPLPSNAMLRPIMDKVPAYPMLHRVKTKEKLMNVCVCV